MTQIFVYIGGISVLLLFGIMLTNSEPVYIRNLVKRPKLIPALVPGSSGLLRHAAGADRRPSGRRRLLRWSETARELGIYLLSEYILPFEIVSVVLLIVLIGAAFIARREQGEGQ